MNKFCEVEVCPGIKRLALYNGDYITLDPAQIITVTAQGILDARALYPDMTLAQMYDEATMPTELREAHALNDRAVMEAYGFEPDASEADIVSGLMEMHAAQATAEKGSLCYSRTTLDDLQGGAKMEGGASE